MNSMLILSSFILVRPSLTSILSPSHPSLVLLVIVYYPSKFFFFFFIYVFPLSFLTSLLKLLLILSRYRTFNSLP